MDKLACIRAFTKVIEQGSFSDAAREMRLSRSAVSKYVIELEENLGVQLLNRTTRSTSPTENGQAYYERCVAILADLEEADLAVSQPSRAACCASMRRCLSGPCMSAVPWASSWKNIPNFAFSSP